MTPKTFMQKMSQHRSLRVIGNLSGAVMALAIGVLAAKIVLFVWHANYDNSKGPSPNPAQSSSVAPTEELTLENVFTEEVATQTRVVSSTTKGKLLGTVGHVATISVDNKTRSYKVGDEVPGLGELVSVSQGLAEILSGRSVILLHVSKNKQVAVSKKPVKVSKIIKAVKNDKQALGKLLTTAKVVPRMKNGAFDGFLLQEVQPNSPLDSAGLKKNDVILMVNNTKLDSPEKGISVFRQLEFAKNIELAIERDGSNKTINISLE